jgi:hypothetical protein
MDLLLVVMAYMKGKTQQKVAFHIIFSYLLDLLFCIIINF